MAIARALVNRPPLLFADEPTGNLDSKTSKEVLQMFQRLNVEEKITIILVTHDSNVAAVAKRTIRISDGLIESGAYGERDSERAADARESGGGGIMKSVIRVFQTALRRLRRNVMRSALTCVGIIIGIAAVIAMTEIGNGVSELNQRAIASLGANTLMIQPGRRRAGANFGAGQHHDADAAGLRCDHA